MDKVSVASFLGVSVRVAPDRVRVAAPYHPMFVTRAKFLGGRWDGADNTWSFNARDEQRVRDLLFAIYGTDGTQVRLVNMRVKLTGSIGDCLWTLGREIVKRRGRDSAVQLGDNVILVSGKFSSSGGSVRYPEVRSSTESPQFLEVRDVPESLALKATERDSEMYAILDNTGSDGPADPSLLWYVSDDILIAELKSRGYECRREHEFGHVG